MGKKDTKEVGLITGNRTFSSLRSFLCLSCWDHSQRNSTWKQSARGKDLTVRKYQERSKAQKAPKNTLICSPVRNISVSDLRIISRRRRHLKNQITDMIRSLWGAAIHSSEHMGQGEIRKETVVLCMWRETRNLWGSVIGLVA